MVDVFNLLKKEKSSKKIVKLNELFYKTLADFIRKRKNLLENVKDETDEIKKLKYELENFKLSFKELHSIRERKILNLALIAAREDIDLPDEENLTPEERTLYNIILNALKSFRKNIIEPVSNGENPNMEKFSEDIERSIKTLRTYKEKNVKILRILREVPQFVGVDLKTYGPFYPEEVIILPNDIAEILINNNHAEEIKVRK